MITEMQPTLIDIDVLMSIPAPPLCIPLNIDHTGQLGLFAPGSGWWPNEKAGFLPTRVNAVLGFKG